MALVFIFTILALLMIVSFSLSLIGQALIMKIKKVSHDFLHTVQRRYVNIVSYIE